MKTLGERIRIVRSSRSQKDFAAAYGIHWNTLRRYEEGEREPSHDFLQRLTQTENLSPEWVMLGEGAMRKSDEGKAPLGSSGESCKDELIVALRENAALLRENGELRLQVERLEAQKAELERRLVEALKQVPPAPMGSEIAAAG